MLPANIHIGTSGYSYPDWLGNFYPQFCPQPDFLQFYSSQFKTVELDVTFYRIPTEKMIQRWVDFTPPEFVFCAKFPRTVTHVGDIKERLETAELFISLMRRMGDKLGVLLLQFPYSFKPEQLPLLQQLLAVVPVDIKLSVEVRNRKWLTDNTLIDILSKRGVALCQVDHPWMPRISVRTADFQYYRFLGDQKAIEDDFSYVRVDREEELNWWSDLIQSYANDRGEIYGYFNNHYTGHAPSTAKQMIDRLSPATGGTR